MPIFAFFPKTVPVHTQRDCINISLFHMPSTLVFRLLEFLSVWDVCNPSFKVFAYNFTVWRSHHLFKSKFWCRACRLFPIFLFYTRSSGCELLSQNKFQEWKCWTKCSTHWNFWSILPTCHLERFYNFTFLSTVFAYLHPQVCFKSNLKKKKTMFCIYLIFSFGCFWKVGTGTGKSISGFCSSEGLVSLGL